MAASTGAVPCVPPRKIHQTTFRVSGISAWGRMRVCATASGLCDAAGQLDTPPAHTTHSTTQPAAPYRGKIWKLGGLPTPHPPPPPLSILARLRGGWGGGGGWGGWGWGGPPHRHHGNHRHNLHTYYHTQLRHQHGHCHQHPCGIMPLHCGPCQALDVEPALSSWTFSAGLALHETGDAQ